MIKTGDVVQLRDWSGMAQDTYKVFGMLNNKHQMYKVFDVQGGILALEPCFDRTYRDFLQCHVNHATGKSSSSILFHRADYCKLFVAKPFIDPAMD